MPFRQDQYSYKNTESKKEKKSDIPKSNTTIIRKKS